MVSPLYPIFTLAYSFAWGILLLCSSLLLFYKILILPSKKEIFYGQTDNMVDNIYLGNASIPTYKLIFNGVPGYLLG